MGQLTDDDRAVLDFKRQAWTYPGAKETAIVQRFGMLSVRYYQVLNALIDRSEARAYDPVLGKRLRRLRDARAQERNAHRLAFDA